MFRHSDALPRLVRAENYTELLAALKTLEKEANFRRSEVQPATIGKTCRMTRHAA